MRENLPDVRMVDWITELLVETTGLNQAGIAEAIAQSIASLPHDLQGMFWSNIVCVGGNTGFAGFEARLCVFSPALCGY